MTQEVLKLALDYLESRGLAWNVQIALREALREHAMREVQRLGQEIEQEPVVWMYQDKSTHEVRFQKHMRDFVDHRATYETPLYTAPPQRKPLTDEEILAANYPDGEENGPTIAAPDFELICFARQIEAANGIKE